METSPKAKRLRGVYLLPNLFTTAALFAGFYAIVAAMKGHFGLAAMAIFIAMALDSLDGRIARMTNAQSEFGAEYDSLSDMVSFGLAPALVIYSWALSTLGKLGWLAAFIYTACAALRLARFNTTTASMDKRFFQGLPSPSAAAVVAGIVWVGFDYGTEGEHIAWFAFAATVMVGLLMVSNIRYYSFKELETKNRVPFVALLLLVLAFVLVSINPPWVLFGVFLLYTVSGPVTTMLLLRRRPKAVKSGEMREPE